MWWNRFGPLFATEIRKQRLRLHVGCRHWRWHLGEVFVKINGVTHYLWWTVDHEGEVLEAVASKHRDRRSALKMLKKLMKRYGCAVEIVTDGLASYGAAMEAVGVRHRHVDHGRRINNRAENSHQPFRRRERAMQRFRTMGTLQKFASIHGSVYNHFNQQRHLTPRRTFKRNRLAALIAWQLLLA